MLEGLTEITNQWLHNRPWLAVGSVFLGGLATAANPCSLAGVPVLIGLVGGQTAVTDWRRGLTTSLVFVAGLATSFSAMAAVASFASSSGSDWRSAFPPVKRS